MMLSPEALKNRLNELCADAATPNTDVLMECLRQIHQLEKAYEVCQRAYFYKSMLNDEMLRKIRDLYESIGERNDRRS